MVNLNVHQKLSILIKGDGTLADDEIEEILDKGDVTNLFSTDLQAKRKECEAIETRNNELQEASDSSYLY